MAKKIAVLNLFKKIREDIRAKRKFAMILCESVQNENRIFKDYLKSGRKLCLGYGGDEEDRKRLYNRLGNTMKYGEVNRANFILKGAIRTSFCKTVLCMHILERIIMYMNEVAPEINLASKMYERAIDIIYEVWNPEPRKKFHLSLDARNILQNIRETDDFSAMPILADALEDSGCVDEDLLCHLRLREGHNWGCWALNYLKDV